MPWKESSVIGERLRFIALVLDSESMSEVCRSRWEWLGRYRRALNLPGSKTGKKSLYLNDPALRVLDEQRERSRDADSPYILPGRTQDKPLDNLSKSWARICERAGLEGVRIHDLRHTAASIAVGRGASLPVIGRLLGHRQAQITMHYARVDANPALAVANEAGE